MNYKILTNKWRPKDLNEIVGQEEIIYIIKSIINSKSIPNSYLISGNPGIGKTTLARIITKCLNCKIGITINPCNKCRCCVDIDNDKSLDSIEIDAASKTKVEDIKLIMENSLYKNLQNRFKTYIIDECHMLSINSFNYLLKILEEQNKKIIYILVTTQIEKIPDTIISRCINLNLKQLSKNSIKKRLLKILNNENFHYEEKALTKLISFSDGSMRQALNILEKIRENINEKNIDFILGIISKEKIVLLIKYILEQDHINIFKIFKFIIESNNNVNNILVQIQFTLYEIILFKFKIIYEKENIKNDIFLYLAKKISIKKLQEMYKLISKEKNFLNFSPNVNIGFEIIILNIMYKLQNHK